MLIAFHGKQEVKDLYLMRVIAHQKADELVKGQYWENGKGCAVGCTIHSGNHASYETELGIPRLIARLEDGIFEALPNARAQKWPAQFLEAIKPGTDLSMVWPLFAVWLLVDEKYGVIQFAKTESGKKAIRDVAKGYQSVVSGKSEAIDWHLLRAVAAYAAAVAAYAADAAAYAAAYAADACAADAAYAAYAAAYAARSKWRIAQADKLLELLGNAPIVGVG